MAIYKWKDGCRLNNIDAEVAGNVCRQLEEEGRLTAKNLLDESRAENAPLHDAFEWDDGTAAELYRTEQAGQIIRCLVTVTTEEAPVVRSFFKINTAAPEYTKTETILSIPEARTSLLKQALRELEYFERKYASLEELSAVFAEIGKLKGEPNGN